MISQLNAGATLTRRNAKYLQLNRRLMTLKTQYDNGLLTIIGYLNGVAANLSDS